jgi:hypothetical protein
MRAAARRLSPNRYAQPPYGALAWFLQLLVAVWDGHH